MKRACALFVSEPRSLPQGQKVTVYEALLEDGQVQRAVPLGSSKAKAYEFGQLSSVSSKHRQKPLPPGGGRKAGRMRTEVRIVLNTGRRAGCLCIMRSSAAVRRVVYASEIRDHQV